MLCDTNGGTLPDEVERVVAEVRARSSAAIGAHFHNDGGCAVANTLAAVRAGRDPGAGLRQRLRRADRQRRSLGGDREPHA